MGKMIRPALLALAALCCAQTAEASDCIMGAGNNCYPSVMDPNNNSYTSSTAITPGTPFVAGRGLYANCTGTGTTTVTMAGGGTVSWTLGAGFQQQPFSVTNVTAVSGCTFGRLN